MIVANNVFDDLIDAAGVVTFDSAGQQVRARPKEFQFHANDSWASPRALLVTIHCVQVCQG